MITQETEQAQSLLLTAQVPLRRQERPVPGKRKTWRTACAADKASGLLRTVPSRIEIRKIGKRK
jgi:hypothetical protein